MSMEEVLRIKETGLASEVVAVSMGPTHCVETLRTALAMGVDRGIHVEAASGGIGVGGGFYPLTLAKLFKALVDVEKPGLIILGKQVLLDKEKQQLTVDREVDGGLETLCLDLPAVITTDLRLNQPRYATLPNIMKAKSKAIKKYTPQDLNVEIKSDIEVIEVTEPPKRKAGVIVSSVDELVDKLKNEAHVV